MTVHALPRSSTLSHDSGRGALHKAAFWGHDHIIPWLLTLKVRHRSIAFHHLPISFRVALNAPTASPGLLITSSSPPHRLLITSSIASHRLLITSSSPPHHRSTRTRPTHTATRRSTTPPASGTATASRSCSRAVPMRCSRTRKARSASAAADWPSMAVDGRRWPSMAAAERGRELA